MQAEKKRKLTIGGLYFTIALFAIYIFIMFLLNGVEWAPMVKGKMKNPDFSLATWKLFFYPHIFLGTIALAIGPFQLTKISRRKPKLHKMLGKIYAVAIFINILVVPYISLSATGGRGTMIAFLVLNALWLWTTAMGVIKATQRKISAHKEWILRSYAITWVFVTFRIVVIPFSLFLDSSVAFPIAVYLGIALNLLFVEWRKQKNKKTTSGRKINSTNPVV
ncbi:DUF2306 domain-containing protein [Neobacillus novalis]|uniref:DUF2306 domain-containing protein n=1 Tax=Neobacillus novalis TaxID=220687 RepID=A0AA95S9F7_9BACI|nr:DUF2306 domain-containing protein [Neobacillus novalis]WHY84209.1 DUF2306 domain-containing protein [Neobacillus novalis]